ncbi:hypothetical protein BGZ47_009106 [Haplosporangium gracile]|nr:hypothetical protein BGZ47_009106 [Haplosporangium gracile]
MHQSALFLTLATVVLGASARANIYTNTDTTTNAIINTNTNTNTNTQTTTTVSLARGRMPTALEVIHRQLDYDINNVLAKEHKLITVDRSKAKRDFQMSTGYVWDAAKVNAKSQDAVVAKRDLDVNAKPEYQHLSARHKYDNDDDWEDNEEEEGEDENEGEDEDQILNETESVGNNNKEAKKKKKEDSSSSDKKKKASSSSSSMMGQNNAASRTNTFTALSIAGLLVGSTFLWA